MGPSRQCWDSTFVQSTRKRLGPAEYTMNKGVKFFIFGPKTLNSVTELCDDVYCKKNNAVIQKNWTSKSNWHVVKDLKTPPWKWSLYSHNNFAWTTKFIVLYRSAGLSRRLVIPVQLKFNVWKLRHISHLHHLYTVTEVSIYNELITYWAADEKHGDPTHKRWLANQRLENYTEQSLKLNNKKKKHKLQIRSQCKVLF